MIAVIFGLIYLRIKVDQSGVQNINGVVFLLLLNSSFNNLFAVINVNIMYGAFFKYLLNSIIFLGISSRNTNIFTRTSEWNV